MGGFPFALLVEPRAGHFRATKQDHLVAKGAMAYGEPRGGLFAGASSSIPAIPVGDCCVMGYLDVDLSGTRNTGDGVAVGATLFPVTVISGITAGVPITIEYVVP